MSTHTPGPWILDMADGEGYICAEGNGRMEPVAHVAHLGDADAKLMAAAPDMLEALRGILFVECTAAGRSDIRWDAVHAAIAKAGL